jgi:hypothetical protein
MKSIKISLSIAAIIASISCGKDSNCDGKSSVDLSRKCESETKDIQTSFKLKGSVTSAFDVTVDEKKYSDMETFFTEEKSKLPEKIKDAGFDGYAVDFDAKIGFNDLVLGMVVFVQSASDRGYASKGAVGGDGNFSIDMPAEASGDTYKVRSNKRISVILTKGAETKKFCYNFSAIDLEVPYGEKDKPIVLNNFTSTLTTYECSSDANQGLGIPKNPDGTPAESVVSEQDRTITIKKWPISFITATSQLAGISLRTSNNSLYLLDCGRSKIYSWSLESTEPTSGQEESFACPSLNSYSAIIWDKDDALVVADVRKLDRYDSSFTKQTSISIPYSPTTSGYLDGSKWVAPSTNGQSEGVFGTDVITGIQAENIVLSKGDITTPLDPGNSYELGLGSGLTKVGSKIYTVPKASPIDTNQYLIEFNSSGVATSAFNIQGYKGPGETQIKSITSDEKYIWLQTEEYLWRVSVE